MGLGMPNHTVLFFSLQEGSEAFSYIENVKDACKLCAIQCLHKLWVFMA